MLHNGYSFAEICDIMRKAGVKGCGEKILLPCGYIKCEDGVYCDKCVDDYYIKHLSPVKKERIKIGFCKDCFFSSTISDSLRYCLNTKIRCLNINDIDLENDHNNLMYEYDENGKFYVGDYFGCVHFKNK